MLWIKSRKGKKRKKVKLTLDKRQKVMQLESSKIGEPIQRQRVTVLSAQEVLGVALCHPIKKYATVRPHGSNGRIRKDWSNRSIVVRQGPVDLSTAFLSLFTVNRRVTVVWRSVKKNITHILDDLDAAKKAKNNVAYSKYADALAQWIWSPGRDVPPYGWDCVYWAASSDIIPEGEELTAALDPKFIARDFQVSNIMRSVINRDAMNTVPTRDDALDNASPNMPKFRGNHMLYDGQVVIYFSGEFKKTKDGNFVATKLLDGGYDILIGAEPRDKLTREGETTRVVYISPVLRHSFDVNEYTTEESIQAWISSKEATLRGKGSWKLIKGKHKLLQAFQAYVPGSPPPPWWKRYSIPNPNAFFFSLGERVHKADLVEGDLSYGHSSGSPVCGDTKKDYMIMVCGKQGSGKTTLALATLVCIAPFWIAVKMNADDNEALNFLGGDFGGTDLLLDLPDAQNKADQDRLLKSDREDALRTVEVIKAGCHRADYVTTFPLVIRPVVDSIRFFEYALILTEELTLWWKEFKRLYPEVPWLVLLLDDLRNIPAGEDDYLGDMAEKTGRKWKLWIFKIGGKIRKRFTRIVVTIHSVEEFDNPSWPRGTYPAFSTDIEINLDGFSRCNVINPKTGGKLYKNVQLNLSGDLVKIMGDR